MSALDLTKSLQLVMVDWLNSQGIVTYLPNQHEGQAKPREKYVVIKPTEGMQLDQLSTTQQIYDVLCYVGRDVSSELEVFTDKVEASLTQLRQYIMIRDTLFRGPHFYDDILKAHMLVLRFITFRKTETWNKEE